MLIYFHKKARDVMLKHPRKAFPENVNAIHLIELH